MKFVDILKRLFARIPQPVPTAGNGGPAANALPAQKLLGMLANTQEVELTCDEVFALLDQFAEMAARGEDVASLMPLVKHHLDMCGDCQEEYQALLNVLRSAYP